MSIYYRMIVEIKEGDTSTLTEDSLDRNKQYIEFGRIEGEWKLKRSSDRQFVRLRGSFDERVRVEWGASITQDHWGYGPLVGYFNTKSHHLFNSIFVGTVAGRLVAGIGGSDDVVITYTDVIAEPGDPITFTATYAPCGPSGVFLVDYYTSPSAVFQLQGPMLPGCFEVDSFGVSNVDLTGTEDLWRETDPAHFQGVKGVIKDLYYIDPTIPKRAQEVPKLYALPDRGEGLPLPALINGIHYERKGQALNFFDSYWPHLAWAERIYYDNTIVSDTFGRICRVLLEEYSHTTSEYKAMLQGIMGAFWQGPTLGNLARGMRLLTGLPFMKKDGEIVGINKTSRDISITVKYYDGSYETFEFPSDYDVATHPTEKDRKLKKGDILPAGTPLSGGIEAVDYIKDPDWWKTFKYDELQKYYTFCLRFKKIRADWALVSPAIASFLTNAKPAGTKLTLARENNTPLFQFGDKEGHKPYAEIDLLANNAGVIPADYTYLEDIYFYYVSPDRLETLKRCKKIEKVAEKEVFWYEPTVSVDTTETTNVTTTETTTDLEPTSETISFGQRRWWIYGKGPTLVELEVPTPPLIEVVGDYIYWFIPGHDIDTNKFVFKQKGRGAPMEPVEANEWPYLTGAPAAGFYNESTSEWIFWNGGDSPMKMYRGDLINWTEDPNWTPIDPPVAAVDTYNDGDFWAILYYSGSDHTLNYKYTTDGGNTWSPRRVVFQYPGGTDYYWSGITCSYSTIYVVFPVMSKIREKAFRIPTGEEQYERTIFVVPNDIHASVGLDSYGKFWAGKFWAAGVIGHYNQILWTSCEPLPHYYDFLQGVKGLPLRNGVRTKFISSDSALVVCMEFLGEHWGLCPWERHKV